MGRNLPVLPLGIKKTRKFFQESGNSPLEKILLKTARSSLRILSGRREINKLFILSRPGADFSLEKFFFREMVSSVREKGLEKI